MIRRRAAIFLMIGVFLLVGSGCATASAFSFASTATLLTSDAAPPTSDAAPPTSDAAPPTSDAAPPTSDAAPPTSVIPPHISTPATPSPTPSTPTAVALLAWIHSNRQTEAAPEPIYETSRDTVTLHCIRQLPVGGLRGSDALRWNELSGDR